MTDADIHKTYPYIYLSRIQVFFETCGCILIFRFAKQTHPPRGGKALTSDSFEYLPTFDARRRAQDAAGACAPRQFSHQFLFCSPPPAPTQVVS